jgi:hypothetical protein
MGLNLPFTYDGSEHAAKTQAIAIQADISKTEAISDLFESTAKSILVWQFLQMLLSPVAKNLQNGF